MCIKCVKEFRKIGNTDLEETLRLPAMAGRFYEGDAGLLRADIAGRLERAGKHTRPPMNAPLGLLVPHAGYVYSGDTAAAAFLCVRDRQYNGVLILGPSHTDDFHGFAVAPHQGFLTPLGEVPLDCEAGQEICRLDPVFFENEHYHQYEHGIEVELPFLQETLQPGWKLVAISVGRNNNAQINRASQRLSDWLEDRLHKGERWLVVASSDTYHGHNAEACLRNDEHLTELLIRVSDERMLKMARNREVMACGWIPLVITLHMMRAQGIRHGEPLARADSRREDSQPGDYVVGYLAARF